MVVETPPALGPVIVRFVAGSTVGQRPAARTEVVDLRVYGSDAAAVRGERIGQRYVVRPCVGCGLGVRHLGLISVAQRIVDLDLAGEAVANVGC